VLGMSTLDQII